MVGRTERGEEQWKTQRGRQPPEAALEPMTRRQEGKLVDPPVHPRVSRHQCLHPDPLGL
jgi:hypothetical protein